MNYDLEIVVPVSSKYTDRLDDFKKYGISNIKNKSVLLTMILSGEKIEGLEKGWIEGVDARTISYESRDYASNLYRNFLEKKCQSRWIMKIDDDSHTDISGLVDNLDFYYDSEEKFYLATSLLEMGHCGGSEHHHAKIYKEFFGDIYLKIKHELECCVISKAGFNSIFSNKKSINFIEKRCKMDGGATDVALAFAASMAKVWPVSLPFTSHLPEIENLSYFGGFLNHIHMVSRNPLGDNFQDWERCKRAQYEILTRSIDKTFTEKENKIVGKKMLMDTEHELFLYEFKENRTVRIKFDDRKYIWLEHEGIIKMFCNSNEEQAEVCLELQENGDLVGKRIDGLPIKLTQIPTRP